MNIQLSDHFDYKRLIRFVFPSLMMMVFTSIYGVVDGYFVSNYAGKSAFAAVNLIMPFPMVLGAVGFMIGTGGTALVSKTLGEGREKQANEIFSLLIYTTIILGIILSIGGLFIIEPVAYLLGANESIIEYCIQYGSILLISTTFYMLQNLFQSFLIVAQKPGMGLKITVIAGLTNMILDAIFLKVFHFGVSGAALATAISQCIGGLLPFFYFIKENDSLLKIGKTHLNYSILLKTCTNGSSEFVSNISMSFISMLYNIQLMKYAGENGVAAYGVLMYVNFIFIAIYIGYSIGVAPLIGYNYGAKNNKELHNIFKKSITLNLITGIILTISAILLSKPLAYIFVGYDLELYKMTIYAFLIYSLSFLFSGISLFGSSLFTALNNGFISALISFFRTLVFQIFSILILPLFFQINGIWYSIVVAEVLACLLTTIIIMKFQKKYHY